MIVLQKHSCTANRNTFTSNLTTFNTYSTVNVTSAATTANLHTTGTDKHRRKERKERAFCYLAALSRLLPRKMMMRGKSDSFFAFFVFACRARSLGLLLPDASDRG